MPITPHQHSVDPGGVIRLRPHSATVLCLVVWIPTALLSLDALVRAGWEAVGALPLALAIAVCVWALLWSPCLVLREDRVEVRNILVTHVLPFVAIERVRIGAMIRFDVLDEQHDEHTVTAWNAPSLPRDRVRMARSDRAGLTVRPSMEGSQETRLAADQAACRSAVVRTRWLAWQDRNENAPFEAAVRRPRWVVIGGVLSAAALLVLRLAG